VDEVATTKNYAKKVVSVRDVLRKTHKAEIHAIVAEKTKDKVGSTGWLKYYPGAVNQVLDGLSKKEMEQTEDDAKQWTETGAPRDVQRQ
jgi:hypothetical protein